MAEREISVIVKGYASSAAPDTSGSARGEGTLEPIHHPDLVRLGRTLRERMDRTLDAELDAARSAARRQCSLRDRLLDADDRGDRVVLWVGSGQSVRGTVDGVGIDHFDVVRPGSRSTIAIEHLAILEVPE